MRWDHTPGQHGPVYRPLDLDLLLEVGSGGQLYAFLNATENVPQSLGPLDAEVMLLEGCLDAHLTLTFTVILLQARTRGRLAVASRNPFTPPQLDYKPLSHQADVQAKTF